MTELLNRPFLPINERGHNSIRNGGETLLWIYNPSDENLNPELVVSKPPGHHNQVFMGPQKDVIKIALAFNLLDSLGLGQLRAMSVLIIPSPLESSVALSYELLQRFRLLEELDNSTAITRLNAIGVTPELRLPIVRFPQDLHSWIKKEDLTLSQILFAAQLLHEWTHVQQKREDLPVLSLWSERSAMSQEGEFLLTILLTGMLNRSQEFMVAYYLRYLSRAIENYRNGVDFQHHLLEKYNVNGTPIKNQQLHTEDFRFGQ